MSAMEAVLAARRSPPAQAPEPQAARGPGADLRFQVWHLSLPCGGQSSIQHPCYIVV